MKTNNVRPGRQQPRFPLRAVTAMLWAAGLVSLPVQAGPVGGVVSGGNASIQGGGPQTRIVQHSDRAIIDWRGFDIGLGEAVLFQQPSATSAVLNRIGGSQGTRIDGRLDANGQVFIVNPNGVIFGRDAQINVGSLLTTTANIANRDFLAGRLRFDQPGRPGSAIRNEGRITAAEGGLVALVAPTVRNDGVIAARLGRVALATGQTFTLDLYGDDLIHLAVPDDQLGGLVDAQGQPLASRLDHTGTIDAAGGRVVFMSAAAGKAALDQVINLSGTVRADTVDQHQGQILLSGAGATARVTGRLEARGDDAGESGGRIHLVADNLTLQQAGVDVSGSTGGGSVQVGGNWQGQGSGPRAQTVSIDAASQLRADAKVAGSGGEVVVWADGRTDFAGSISARGGPQAGDGGRVEVSGKGSLNFAGDVDAGTSRGQPGLLLLDPEYLTIGSLEAGIIGRVLRTGTSTALQADQDITVAATIDGRGLYAGGGLSLDAGHDILIDSPILTHNGAINLNARGGTVSFAPGTAVFAGTAPIHVTAGGTLHTGSLITGGTLTLISTGGAVHLDAPVEPDNGDLQVTARGDIAVNAPLVNLRSGGSIDLSAGGSVHVNAQVDGLNGVPGGSVTIKAGDGVAVNQFIATGGGPISVTSGGLTSIAPSGGLLAGSGSLQVAAAGGIQANGALDAGGGMRLESGHGTIALDTPIAATTGDVLIRAGQDILIRQPVVNLQSGASLDAAAQRDIVVTARIDGGTGTPGGAVRLDAGHELTVTEAISTGNGAISLHSGGATHIAGTAGLFAGSGAISASAGTVLETGPVVTTGPVTLSAGGQLLSGPVSAGGSVSLAGANLRLTQPIFLSAGGSLSLTTPGSVSVEAFLGGSEAGGISIAAGGNASVTQPIVTGSGLIDIDAGGSLWFAGAGGAYSGGGIRLDANGTVGTGPLAAAGPVSLRAGSDLTVGGPLNFGPGGPLSASAGRNIAVQAPIHGSGSAGASLSAGGTVAIGRDVAVDGGTLSVSGNSVDFAGGGLFGGRGNVVVTSAASLVTGTLQGAGGVSVSSSGDLTVATPIGTGTGSVGLTAAGDIDINAPIAGVGSLGARAGGDLTINARIDANGSVVLGAGHDVLVNQDVVATGGPILVNAGGTLIQAPNGLDVYGAPMTHQLRAGSGGISVTTGGDLHTGSLVTPGRLNIASTGGDVFIDVPVYETTGPTAISAAGDIHVNQVVANATSGADLSMTAGGQIHVDAKIGPWDRSDSTYPTLDRNAVPGGRISLTAGGDINLNQPVATYRGGLADATAGALSITSTAGSVNIAPNLRISSDTGTIAVTSYGDLHNGPPPTLPNDPVTTGYFTGGHLSLASSHGSVVIDQTIPDSTGSVTISAFDGVRINQRIHTNDGDIHIIAGPGGILQDLTTDPAAMGDYAGTLYVSDINAGHGNLTLEAVGDIRPSSLRTGAELKIVSSAGQIIGGQVEDSFRGPDVATLIHIGRPAAISLAGYAGIANFNAKTTASLRAISAAGSISNLTFLTPNDLILVAAQDIVGATHTLGLASGLYAGRDVLIAGGIEASQLAAPLIIRAGRDILIESGLTAPGATFSAGTNPFAGLGSLTIAGVAMPAWSGLPAGSSYGSVAVGTTSGQIWIGGPVGLTVTATGNITLPKVHLGAIYSPGTHPNDSAQPLILNAGRDISVTRIETLGDIAIRSTGGNITLGSTIGPHVTPDPTRWNPTDLGVASLLLVADSGNIAMHEARAVGDIDISAPLGQVVFAGGLNGVESTGGTTRVIDSDGVVFSPAIAPTIADRLPVSTSGGATITPGPTMAGPTAPSQPGALPPAAPAAMGIAAASPTLGGTSAPRGGSTGGTSPQTVTVAGSGTGASNVAGTGAPGGSDDFGEIFVAEAPAPRRDPDAADAAGDGNTDSPMAGEPEERKKQRPQLATLVPMAGVVVFAGGRGDAREKDFGREERIEYNRVRP